MFLMDEPLSNLDAKLRVQTRTEIAALQRELGVTTLYVTHDQTEALTMGDRIAVLNGGILQQAGSPRELYDAPQNVFVAGFIGSPAMNLLECTKDEDHIAHYGDARIPIPAVSETEVTVGFRPESIELVSDSEPNTIPIKLDFVEELGSDSYLYGHITGTPEGSTQVVVRTLPNSAPAPGSVFHVRINPDEHHVFATATGERLPV